MLPWLCANGHLLRVGDASPSNVHQSGGTSVIKEPSVCPSKTVNYITHRLPQQCLRTGWSSANATTLSRVDNAPSTTTTGSTASRNSVGAAPTPSSDGEHEEHRSSKTTPAAIASEEKGDTTAQGSSSEAAPSSTWVSTANSIASKAEVDIELDSALDNANFLSFEEWKRRNLAKAGQSPESLGDRRLQSAGEEGRQRPRSINHALDSLGDDTEIDLDFGRFRSSTDTKNEVTDKDGHVEPGKEIKPAEGDNILPQKPRQRSRDAGKTCKERFNYASFDCAATVLKSNPESKGSSSILVENKDSYMLNECSAANKFFIVELCDDILIDTIVLANFEFFSSIFRTFRISVSDRYPIKMEKWKELGTFEARNTREMQVFWIENPLIWARYIRVELLTHYGSEFYCPISLLRVHGTTMMEEFKHQEDLAKGEDDVDGEEVVEEDEMGTKVDENKVDSVGHTQPESVDGKEVPQVNETQSQHEDVHAGESSKQGSSASQAIKALQTLAGDDLFFKSPSSPVCRTDEVDPTASPTSSRDPNDKNPSNTTLVDGAQSTNATHQPSSGIPYVQEPREGPATPNTPPKQETIATQQAPLPPTKVPSHEIIDRTISPSSSAVQPPLPHPTTQESFFKTVHKRLQLLETNATLSLQYIEEQSQILRDAFSKVEKRQLAKTHSFLEDLNATVFAELKGFRQQYDQIWQSTVLELEHQREQSQREILAVSARLSILADEVILQKRMAIIQSILLLLCLAFVIFSRSTVIGNHLELPPIMSNMSGSRSRSGTSTSPDGGGHNRDGHDRSQSGIRFPFVESPFGSPRLTRPSSASRGDEMVNSGTGTRTEGRHGVRQDRNGNDHRMLSPPRLKVGHSLRSTTSSMELLSVSDSEGRSEDVGSSNSSPERKINHGHHPRMGEEGEEEEGAGRKGKDRAGRVSVPVRPSSTPSPSRKQLHPRKLHSPPDHYPRRTQWQTDGIGGGGSDYHDSSSELVTPRDSSHQSSSGSGSRLESGSGSRKEGSHSCCSSSSHNHDDDDDRQRQRQRQRQMSNHNHVRMDDRNGTSHHAGEHDDEIEDEDGEEDVFF
ncbi:MAG: hypothetical protein M1823_005207 [Watsoniomyces obsoletus]|nr:MAG: hypothetical protein M1823_005207 [Watsoniomyces obsoletus]